MEDFFINMGVTALFMSIKNANSKARLRKLCLKVVNVIKAAYAGDPDFA
jgi:hypothetical protein